MVAGKTHILGSYKHKFSTATQYPSISLSTKSSKVCLSHIAFAFSAARFTSLPPIITTPEKSKKKAAKRAFYAIKLWKGFTQGLLCKSSNCLQMTATNLVHREACFTIPLAIFQNQLLTTSSLAFRTTCILISIIDAKVQIRRDGDFR